MSDLTAKKIGSIKLPEGTMTLTMLTTAKTNAHEFLTHSCKGNIDFHRIDTSLGALVCSKCGMRLVIRDKTLDNLQVSTHKVRALFEWFKNGRPMVEDNSINFRRLSQ